jgi:hypothetical protein
MNPADRTWLENRVHAAVDDDYYLDRDEEKRIKEEASSRGISIRDIELVVREELQKTGSVSERQLLDELERLLHQFTDDDKYLDKKEERDAFDQVIRPATGKRKGLDARVAEDFAASFCKVNGIRRQTERSGSRLLVPAFGVLLLAAIIVAALIVRGGAPGTGQPSAAVGASDRSLIDAHLKRAADYIDRAQYTEPPERSAKAELDAIVQADPEGTYRHPEVTSLQHRIVEHYLTLAEKSARQRKAEAARQWLARARLVNIDAEEINEKERELGLTAP